jgi:DNA-binding NarL/FixJ family response regulator
MERVRVLLLEIPRLLREILAQAIDADGGCELLTESGSAWPIDGKTRPDIVILGLIAEGDAALVPALFACWPRAQVVTVMQAGNAAAVYELRPTHRLLGEMSPTEIVQTLRDAVRRNRGDATGNNDGNGARSV